MCIRDRVAFAQTGESLPPAEDLLLPGDTLNWPEELPDPYAPLNAALGGDSVRMVNGSSCTGWVEDRYPDGVLKHRGYYGDGRIITYRNFPPNGQMVREFRMKDQTRSSMPTFYDNGILRSETRFVDGLWLSYVEHYPSGQVRYTEEKHPSLPYYTVMDLFAPDGTPVVPMDGHRGLGNCSLLDPQSVAALRSLTPGTYHVRVGATAAAAAYRLLMRTSQCGNSVREGRELCDDGNASDGDGCTNLCTPPVLAESGPNDSIGGAQEIIQWWNRFFPARPGHWAGFEILTYPAFSSIAFMGLPWPRKSTGVRGVEVNGSVMRARSLSFMAAAASGSVANERRNFLRSM